MSVVLAKRPWVAYIGPFGYPEGGAAARRVLGMAQSLSISGMDVVIASGAGTDMRGEGVLLPQGDGISYCMLAERVAEHWPRPLRRMRYAWMGARTVEWMSSQPVLPQAVVLYSGYTPYLQKLLPWCRKHGVRLLFDAVEWYEPEHRWEYLTSPYQWNIEWAMRRLVPKVDSVIAISQYLADYYSQRGKQVAIVPPTTSAIAAGAWQPNSTLRLCYAGSPGHKDDLRSILQAVAMLVTAGAPVQLTIAGPERPQVLAMLGVQAATPVPWLHTPGLLGHDQVQRLVGTSDFSILARQQTRVSQAGFPTKFVESFASGTPVIANLTSDLHLHLLDQETGLVCAASDAESLVTALKRALMIDEHAMRRMRGACIEHAKKVFHPAKYVSVLSNLILHESEVAK